MSESADDGLLAWAEARFRPLLALLVGLYLAIESLYVLRLPLVTDEFQGLYSVVRLRTQLPYVDFVPYKTVLGYYLQLPWLLVSEDPWVQMIAIKLATAFGVAAAIYAASRLLVRSYRPAAVLLATALLVFMSTFLERSAVLRVDMLTALAGLFALLCLLERRIVVAGALTGLAFLVSQKGVYYGVAGGVALAGRCALVARDRRSALDALRFGLAAAAPVVLYFGFWTLLASYGAVFDQVVVKSAGVARDSFYEIRHFWFQTIFRNPFFWALGVLALGQLYASRSQSPAPRRDWTLLLYASTLFALCLWHKQPWPYFFVLLIPTVWVLVTSYYDFELEGAGRLSPTAIGLLVALGIALPASRIPSVLARDNSFQRFTVSTAHRIVGEQDTYLAGLAMLPSRRQASRSLAWLDRPKLEALAGDDASEILAELAQARLKLVIVNYRLPGLPPAILGYLQANYLPLAGNLMIYAPTIGPGRGALELPFTGVYRVHGAPGTTVEVGGRAATPGEALALEAGSHTLLASSPARLQLLPPGFEDGVEERFRQQQPLFADNYTY